MDKKILNNKLIYLIIIIIFSFLFNYHYANLGVFPIDTFAFFDTAYNILLDRHPFKDIWVTTGPLVDYLQSFFFKIFGLKWSSYVIHSSFINSLISLIFFTTLVNFKLDKLLSFFYTIGLGTLCYTISGTPFAYIHSYVFSLLSVLLFFNGILLRSKKYFFFLPITMSLAFLSMQNPSTFVNFVIVIMLSIYFFKKENREYITFFLGGSLTIIIFFFGFLNIFKIPLENFIQQYFLFPLSMGDIRLSGDEMAHISLSERLTFRNVVGHFKFINFFIFILLFVSVIDFFKKKISFDDLTINLCLIFTGLFLIFNQLITSNQTYIFSYIPFIAAFTHIYFKKRKNGKKLFRILIFILMTFSVVKYHQVYNEKRKFMDLQNTNLEYAVDASNLHIKFKGLKWITPFYSKNVNQEIDFIKQALNNILNDEREIMVLTEYQFFSFLTEKNLNIPNRWYTHDNNSYPLDNHKYFKFYKSHIRNLLKKNEITVVYTIGAPKFENFKIYLEDICHKRQVINEITTIYKLENCN